MHKNIKILQAAELPDKTQQQLRDTFTVLQWPNDVQGVQALLAEHGSDIKGIALRKHKIDADMIARMPALEIISSYSAGLEGVDVAAARARGIEVSNTSDVLAEDVADMGLYLMIAVARGMHNAHAFVRDDRWPTETAPLGRSLRSIKVGIVGLGHTG